MQHMLQSTIYHEYLYEEKCYNFKLLYVILLAYIHILLHNNSLIIHCIILINRVRKKLFRIIRQHDGARFNDIHAFVCTVPPIFQRYSFLESPRSYTVVARFNGGV